MCKLKSCIVLKDRIFCPDYDSHNEMLEELGLKDTRKNAERLFVRVELSPKNEDVFSPVDTWKMKVDQDILPEWWVPEAEEPRVREAVNGWAKKHIFSDVKNLKLNGGIYYLKNSTAELWDNSTATLWENSTAELRDNSTATLWENSTAELRGNSTAELWDNSTATLWENSTAELRDNSTATLWENSTAELRGNSTATLRGNSTAELWDNSTAELRGNSTATLRDNSTATLRDNSTATLRDNSTGIIPDSNLAGKNDNYVIMDSSTLKNCKEKVIYQSGSWKFVEVAGDGKIK